MFVRSLFAAAVALLGSLPLATPAAANVSARAAAIDPYAMTSGRFVGAVAALVALGGVVIAGVALARPSGRIRIGNREGWAAAALVAGLTGVLLGGLVVAAADGGPGTGDGIVGGVAALVIGVVATVLGWLARTRSRRTV